MLQLMAVAVLVLHSVACAFYLLSRQTGTAQSDHAEAVGWAFCDAAINKSATLTTKYIRSIYWVLTTWVTIGFGQFVAYCRRAST